MNRIAVFVDAGYFYASASELLFGAPLRRGELRLANAEFAHYLAQVAETIGGCPLLRIYWYDGASTGPNAAHVALAYRPNLKLRLGRVDAQGQQQGVDQLLVADLVTLAKNRALCDAVLVTGDDDLRDGVEEAQALGVRVHLIGIPPARENQAAALVQAADSVRELSSAELKSFLSLAPKRSSGA